MSSRSNVAQPVAGSTPANSGTTALTVPQPASGGFRGGLPLQPFSGMAPPHMTKDQLGLTPPSPVTPAAPATPPASVATQQYINPSNPYRGASNRQSILRAQGMGQPRQPQQPAMGSQPGAGRSGSGFK